MQHLQSTASRTGSGLSIPRSLAAPAPRSHRKRYGAIQRPFEPAEESQGSPCCCHASTATPALLQQPARSWSMVQLQRIYSTLAMAAAATLWLGLMLASDGPGLFASATLATHGPGANLVYTSAASGLAAGFLHTLCGPDHLAALTPLTINRNRWAAALLGSLWGLGHSTGQLFLGIAFSLLKEQFTQLLPFLEQWCGIIVAATLIAIGALGLKESVFDAGDSDAESSHHHDDEDKLREIAGDKSRGSGRIAAATYATGILYGLQPDALFVVIPALALPTRIAAFSYCLMFVIGTVVAMGGYTLFIGAASSELCKDRPWLQQNLSAVASGIAILVGVLMLLAGCGVAVPFFS